MTSETSRYRDCRRCVVDLPDLQGNVHAVICLTRRRRQIGRYSQAITGPGMPTLHDSGVQILSTGQVVGAVQVKQKDRLDQLAAQALGQPELSWMIADANPCIFPDEIVSMPGDWIIVPQLPGRNPDRGNR